MRGENFSGLDDRWMALSGLRRRRETKGNRSDESAVGVDKGKAPRNEARNA